jgi:hypothetical protein
VPGWRINSGFIKKLSLNPSLEKRGTFFVPKLLVGGWIDE